VAAKQQGYSKAQLQQVARQAAVNAGIDPRVFVRQINQESGFRVKARSGAGALGIAQIMPETAAGWGVDPMDPIAALHAAADAMGKYVHSYGGDYRRALAAYNAGPGAVAKYGGVPPYAQTQQYVSNILSGITPGGAGSARAASAAPTGPTVPAGGSGTADRVLADQQAALAMVFADDPGTADILGSALTRGSNMRAAARQNAGTTPAAPTTPTGPGLQGQQYDAAHNLHQNTTNHEAPGVHVEGSYHYRKTPTGQAEAQDFGTATNNIEDMRNTARDAYAHPERYNEFFFDQHVPGLPGPFYIKDGKRYMGTIGGHEDHIHAAPRGLAAH
jgi:hypothetical protein